MQVRKYEASTIKEAVDMIKKDLGPDAIILSTKESQGHPHNKKVLITAAVSEETYQKKRIVEETLSRQEKEKFFVQLGASVEIFFPNKKPEELSDSLIFHLC